MDTIDIHPFKIVRAPLFVWLFELVRAPLFVCLFVFFFFFLSDSRIVSHSPFACNWQNRFWDNEPVVARFLSNKGGNSDIWIPCDSTKSHLAPFMCVVCRVHRLGSSRMSKQNILSLILFILWVKVTNQNRGIYRHCILYLLRLGPLFPNDAEILRLKGRLGLNQITNQLGRC